jgi:hypothetical protein
MHRPLFIILFIALAPFLIPYAKGAGPYRETPTSKAEQDPHWFIRIPAYTGGLFKARRVEAWRSATADQRAYITQIKALIFAQLKARYPVLAHLSPEALARIISIRGESGGYLLNVFLMGAQVGDIEVHPSAGILVTIEHLVSLATTRFRDRVITNPFNRTLATPEEINELILVKNAATKEELQLAQSLAYGARTEGDALVVSESIRAELARLNHESQELQRNVSVGTAELERLQARITALTAEQTVLSERISAQRRSLERYENDLTLNPELGNSALLSSEKHRATLAAGIRAFLQAYHLGWQQRLFSEAPEAGLQGMIQYDL